MVSDLKMENRRQDNMIQLIYSWPFPGKLGINKFVWILFGRLLSFFFSVSYPEHVRELARQEKEGIIAVSCLNKMSHLGMPKSYRVNCV
jgi:hypothetical protein